MQLLQENFDDFLPLSLSLSLSAREEASPAWSTYLLRRRKGERGGLERQVQISLETSEGRESPKELADGEKSKKRGV